MVSQSTPADNGVARQSSSPQVLTAHHTRDAAILRFVRPAAAADQTQLATHMSVARTAYAKAFVTMRRCAKGTAAKQVLEGNGGGSGSQEVADTAMQLCAAQSVEDRSATERFVEVLHHYHGVFDVLSQADWSYLTLLWGGMKLILVVSRVSMVMMREEHAPADTRAKMAKNRNDLFASILDMLVEIGLSLSRLEVYTKLYPTVRMVELTSQLYAAVIEFIGEVVAHFQRNILCMCPHELL